jgi:hypothetical protein
LGDLKGVTGEEDAALETSVLDYQTSQEKLLPLLATSYGE